MTLAQIAYDHAVANYNTKDARYDVIVECYDIAQLTKELGYMRVTTEAGARQWVDEVAGVHHEVELNQAWDGPESCIGSSMYQPDRGQPDNAQEHAYNDMDEQAANEAAQDAYNAREEVVAPTPEFSTLYGARRAAGCRCSDAQLYHVGCDCGLDEMPF